MPAQLFEEVKEQHVLRVKWAPKEKTQVVLIDALDATNGHVHALSLQPVYNFPGYPLAVRRLQKYCSHEKARN